MNTAEKVLAEIIRDKVQHVQDFIDMEDSQAASQICEEIIDLTQILVDNKLIHIEINNEETSRYWFDLITSEPQTFIKTFK